MRALVKTGQVIELVKRAVNLDDMIAKRVEFLTAYQNAAYAARYKAFVDKVRTAEAEVAFSQSMTRPDAKKASTKLTEAVARYLFKLMAYKDEYEVARLHSDTGFLAKVATQFEGEMGKDYQLAYHLAPPRSPRRNAKGELQKQRFGPWMLLGVSSSRQAEGPARHAARSVRPDRGAPGRARADPGIPRLDRGSAARPRPGQHRPGDRDRAASPS